MRRLLIAAALLIATPIGAIEARSELPEWMAGTWAMEDGSDWADEMWTDPRGGLMLGVARMGFGSQLRTWEVTQIRRRTANRRLSSRWCWSARKPSNSPIRRTITRSGSAIGARASC
jgi:hypothetical protein